MNAKTFLISTLPAILFTVGIIFLSYSPLTMLKAITVQNQVFVIFFQELNRVDLLSAIVKSFDYFFLNVLWIVLVFLILESSGFLFFLYYFQKVNFKVVLVSQLVMIFLVLVLTNFSITMLMISLSLLAGILWMSRTFMPGEKAFSTGYSVVTSRIGLLSIFLALGILLSLLVNLKSYEQEIQEMNLDLVRNFMPDFSELKESQKKQVEQLTEGFKYALSERYDYLPEETKAECRVLYEGMTESLDSYKQRTFQKIDEETLSEEDVLKVFPFFGLIVKATPVVVAISSYALLAVLTPVMGIFGGIAFSLAKARLQDTQDKGQ